MNLPGRTERRGDNNAGPACESGAYAPVFLSKLGVLLALTVLGVSLVILSKSQKPEVGVPAPLHFDLLDPQLRDYIRQQLVRAREAPNDPESQATLGLVYAANQLWAEACQCFSNYTRLNPKEPLGHLYFAVSTREMGDYTEALQLFRRVAVAFPAFPPAHDRLGTALLRAGEFKEAEEVFRRLIAIAPDEWRGYAGVGEAKLRLNLFNEAIEFLQRARSIEPDSRLLHHLLGYAYRGLGRYEEAEWEMKLGLNSEQRPMPDPWGVSALTHVRLLPQQIELASEQVAVGKPEEAVHILGVALQYHPNNLTVLEHLCIALREMGKPEKALQVAQRMLALDSRSVKAYVLLADASLDLGLKEEALTYANRAVELAPDRPQPRLVKADALFALSRTHEGLTSRKEALLRDPQNPLIALDIGDALLNILNEPEAAREFFEKAVQMDSTLSIAYLRLIDTAILLRDFESARRSLQIAKKLDPRAPGLASLEARLAEQTSTK